jgi:hypothetical protein
MSNVSAFLKVRTNIEMVRDWDGLIRANLATIELIRLLALITLKFIALFAIERKMTRHFLTGQSSLKSALNHP